MRIILIIVIAMLSFSAMADEDTISEDAVEVAIPATSGVPSDNAEGLIEWQ